MFHIVEQSWSNQVLKQENCGPATISHRDQFPRGEYHELHILVSLYCRGRKFPSNQINLIKLYFSDVCLFKDNLAPPYGL